MENNKLIEQVIADLQLLVEQAPLGLVDTGDIEELIYKYKIYLDSLEELIYKLYVADRK